MRFTLWNTGADPGEFFALAQAAEGCGWSSMCLNESVFQPIDVASRYPYTPDGMRFWPTDSPYLEPMTLLPAVAAATQRLRVYPFVTKLVLRDPLLLANQVKTASLLSGGRFSLGVGMSWMREEYAFCGIDWASRRQRFVEMIEIVRLAVTGAVVEYHGEIFDLPPFQQAPGIQAPVPVLVGGHRPWSLRTAARIGDGWCGVPGPIDEIIRTATEVLALVDEAGRDRSGFEIHAGALDAVTVDDYRRLRDAGVTDAVVMPWLGGDLAASAGDSELAVRAHKIDAVKRFADTVIDAL
ncbi:TIGR03619 family F420-dependent LLM class oxidoreductase [Pseudonocardia xishanensis]|uniref:TIGR03619 family F420-dependent LLM class oxidoreductase n=1 Tax=Pseudonocardia xishanensis TaxID=630995 RepID=A0ABP8RFD2_9PSEU